MSRVSTSDDRILGSPSRRCLKLLVSNQRERGELCIHRMSLSINWRMIQPKER